MSVGLLTRLDLSLESALERGDEIHFERMDCAEEIGIHCAVRLVFIGVMYDAPSVMVRRLIAHT